MLPSDRELIQALIEGRLLEADGALLDALLNRSGEARHIVEQWQIQDQHEIGSMAQTASDSQWLKAAMHSMRSEFASLHSEWVETKHDRNNQPTDLCVEDLWKRSIPGIRIGNVLGRGAMGVVYEGFDESLGRRVAIKVPSRDRVQNADTQQRFLREAQSAAQVTHENIVAIHSIQTVAGVPILVQQFVDGETLRDLVERSGPLSAERLMETAEQIAKGLAAAHAFGIIHRDLKPENLMIEKGTGIVRIADFGLAKRESSSLLTNPNVIAGTPSFMSPEQTLGQALDPRSDLFAMGSVLRYAATGTVPFGNEDTDIVLHRIRTHELEPLHKLRPDIDETCCTAIDRLHVKVVTHRTDSAIRFLQELKTPDPQRNRHASHLPFWKWSMIAIGIVGLGTVVSFLPWSSQEEPPIPSPTSHSHSNPVAVAANVSKSDFPFVIRETQVRFQNLEEAIRKAVAGQEILIESEGPFECPQITIGRKRLSILAGEGMRPRLTSIQIAPGRQFLISNADLRLKGIDMDWKSEIEINDMQTMREMPAVSCEEGNLEIEDCTFRRGMSGVCVFGARTVLIRNCQFRGGTHCIGWTATGHEMVVEDSYIEGKNGFLFFFPPIGHQSSSQNRCQLSNVVIKCEASIEIPLVRMQSSPIHVQSQQCQFYSPFLISLLGVPNNARQMGRAQGMDGFMRSALQWSEKHCEHLNEQVYLSSRMLKQPDRRNHGEYLGLKAWQNAWRQEFIGSSESLQK